MIAVYEGPDASITLHLGYRPTTFARDAQVEVAPPVAAVLAAIKGHTFTVREPEPATVEAPATRTTRARKGLKE
ncbi:MAG: hypothetical protein VKP62_06385 [Candidatus Sericytochromatia bacterium]|nr:hypothetical protein [Candidatus Sericytochromatia bacterium]